MTSDQKKDPEINKKNKRRKIMTKYKYKDIKAIKECTPAELRGKGTHELEKYIQVGYFHPSAANWSYQVGVTEYNDRLIEVVSLFGWIK